MTAEIGSTVSTFPVGSIVTARNREWIVLPSQDSSVLRLRPLTGSDDDVIGVLTALETVTPGSFPTIDATAVGDALSTRLLFDAARLRLRDGAAPFRSLGRYGFTPRPYQFVPLIMALRQEPVRLLIADDVGVGKTIEAGMIARELLDRGLIRRIGVVCPAHLCDQWRRELDEKFAIDAVVVQSATFAKLERALPRQDQSVFGSYQHMVVSIDFVKNVPHDQLFSSFAPDLLIVDEAHGAARPPSNTGRSQQKRHDFLHKVMDENPNINLVLATATPHSGFEGSYRSLLGLLNREFDINPEIPLNRADLVRSVVQRKRSDVIKWLGADTPFPKRMPTEYPYDLSPDYSRLLDSVIVYCKDRVPTGDGGSAQQRVRLWAAIGLLRCVLSSPAAAESALLNRAEARQRVHTVDDEDAATAYRAEVLADLVEDQASDVLPVAAMQNAAIVESDAEWNRIQTLVRQAKSLNGTQADTKLGALVTVLGGLLDRGLRPIVFCYYIQTAVYLSENLPKMLVQMGKPPVRVQRVTGEISDEEREEVIADLVAESGPRVLIATDCLSEGVNLQQSFDAVVHFDLPWNPNRLEQREGRVDRFGQTTDPVETVLMIGRNNPVDITVCDVLIRKARDIRRSTGISVPVPLDSESVVQSLIETLLERNRDTGGAQLELGLISSETSRIHETWNRAKEREESTRAYFDQQAIRPEAVQQELDLIDPVLGDADTVRTFLENLLPRFGGALKVGRNGTFAIADGHIHTVLPEDLHIPETVVFDRMGDAQATYLARTSPLVEAMCDATIAEAFLPHSDGKFARATAIWTNAVERRTILALVRLRYSLQENDGEPRFAEELSLAALQPSDGGLRLVEPFAEKARTLLATATATANPPSPSARTEQVQTALDQLAAHPNWSMPIVESRKATLQESHKRLRELTRSDRRTRIPTLHITLQGEPDLLAIAVLVPTGG